MALRIEYIILTVQIPQSPSRSKTNFNIKQSTRNKRVPDKGKWNTMFTKSRHQGWGFVNVDVGFEGDQISLLMKSVIL